MANYRVHVLPELTHNHYLDSLLSVRRGPDGVEFDPKDMFCSGDGYLHFSIPTTLGEEAAWWAVGHDHAVPCNVQVQLLRPGRIDAGLVVAKGELLRAGKQIVASEGRVYQAFNLLAVVSVTWTIFYKEVR